MLDEARAENPIIDPVIRAEPLEMARHVDGHFRALPTPQPNVKACARRLGVHTNTAYHRLNRIARLTGFDPRRFAELARPVTALRMG